MLSGDWVYIFGRFSRSPGSPFSAALNVRACVGIAGMTSAGSLSLGTAALCLGLVTAIAAQAPAPKSQTPVPAKPAAAAAKPAVSPASSSAASAADYNGLVKKYCVGCHNDRNKDRAGSLTLASFDIAKAGQEAEVAERVIRKLQASMMPPPGMPRPEPAAYQSFIHALETTVDAHAEPHRAVPPAG